MREAERGIAPSVALDEIAKNRLREVFFELRENKLAFVLGRTSQKSKVCGQAMDYSDRFRLEIKKIHINHEVSFGFGKISGHLWI